MEKKNYSMEILEAIHQVLTENDWNFSVDKENGVFKFFVGIKGPIKNLSYRILVYEEMFKVCAFSLVGPDIDNPEMMTKMAEFICRANYGLRLGNFEFDMRNGEINFKITILCPGFAPNEEMIMQGIFVPVAMFEKYSPGMADLIFAGTTVQEAMEKCEIRNNLVSS